MPDVLAEGLRILFCGINPGLYSGAVGHHFARPGNRFWKALHGAGFTDRILSPFEEALLPRYGLGITNLVDRATGNADAVSRRELTAGAAALAARVRRYRPRAVAILGIGAYRTAFARPGAVMGLQPEPVGDAPVWVLPNPSGRTAAYQLPRLIEEFRALRDATD